MKKISLMALVAVFGVASYASANMADPLYMPKKGKLISTTSYSRSMEKVTFKGPPWDYTPELELSTTTLRQNFAFAVDSKLVVDFGLNQTTYQGNRSSYNTYDSMEILRASKLIDLNDFDVNFTYRLSNQGFMFDVIGGYEYDGTTQKGDDVAEEVPHTLSYDSMQDAFRLGFRGGVKSGNLTLAMKAEAKYRLETAELDYNNEANTAKTDGTDFNFEVESQFRVNNKLAVNLGLYYAMFEGTTFDQDDQDAYDSLGDRSEYGVNLAFNYQASDKLMVGLGFVYTQAEVDELEYTYEEEIEKFGFNVTVKVAF